MGLNLRRRQRSWGGWARGGRIAAAAAWRSEGEVRPRFTVIGRTSNTTSHLVDGDVFQATARRWIQADYFFPANSTASVSIAIQHSHMDVCQSIESIS